jgi:multidrug efflux pump
MTLAPLAFLSLAGAILAAGISIVGGLCVSPVLNLFSTPVIYLYLDRLRRQPRPAASVVPA